MLKPGFVIQFKREEPAIGGKGPGFENRAIPTMDFIPAKKINVPAHRGGAPDLTDQSFLDRQVLDKRMIFENTQGLFLKIAHFIFCPSPESAILPEGQCAQSIGMGHWK
ncbi:MAG TPA: hypothetical protein VKC51_11430 [Lacunisphaera sp.]|nr:hypothetical protein [Lacunisphaera sp.]